MTVVSSAFISQLKNLGEDEQLLGTELNYKKEKLIDNQINWIKRLLNVYGMNECYVISSLIDAN